MKTNKIKISNNGFYIATLLLALVLAAFSCNSGKSYAEMLKDQKVAVERLFADSGFVLLNSYPTNGKFANNEFYKLENGVYLNVVDSGNGNRAVSGLTSITCRFQAKLLVTTTDTLLYENISNGTFPLVYTYGYSAATSSGGMDYFFSSAMFSPMEYVGDSAHVRLIIPFDVASSYLQTSGDPVFYPQMRYRFELR